MIGRRWKAFVGTSLLTLASFCQIVWSDDFANELHRISPTPANEAIDTFQVADGFEMQLVASEPLIGSPVAIEWDASGAMFVCEMRGYSEDRDDGISGIARLTDSDGDGVYDTRTQYANDLLWPTGLFPFDGGLFVGDAPDLWYMKDTDGDGVADLKQRVFTGFGTSNVQGLMNSFRWGLDNRIHIACSSVGGIVRHARSSEADSGVSVRGRDFAFDPRTHDFVLTSGAAQHGMCFDDWGNKFVSSNSDHIQQVMYEDRYIASNPYAIPPPSRVSIAADGPQAEVFRDSPVEPWRIVRTRLRVAGKAKGPIEGGGRAAGYFTGATGVTIYRGDAWPKKWKGLAIVGDVGSNLIHRKRLERSGLEFVARRIDDNSEFVTSTDIWFRPAQFANAPDGSLHVVDVYREVIEHPLSLPAEIKRHLDLTAGRDRGRIYRIVPLDSAIRKASRFDQASTQDLVKTLSHPNAWHRETAARLLFERQDSAAVSSLRKLAGRSESPVARIHAMAALDGLSTLGGVSALNVETLLPGMDSTNKHVRRHAVRLSESFMSNSKIRDAFGRLVQDPSIAVRYQLAFTVGTLDCTERLPILRDLITHNLEDRWMRAAVLTAIGDASSRLREQLTSEHENFTGPSAALFLEALDKQIAARNRNRGVSQNPTQHLRTSASKQLRSEAEVHEREKVVRQYQSALSIEGDSKTGRDLFLKHCSTCHQVGGVGESVGPNLASVATRGGETVLTGLLDPNREVNPLYTNHIALTVDGRVITGMIIDEGSTSITLRGADAKVQSVLQIEIEELKNTGKSFMPDGFEDSLDRQAVADLIAFLHSAAYE